MGLRNPTDDDAALAFAAHDRALREAHKEIERLGSELNFARDGLRAWEADALLALKQRDAAQERIHGLEAEVDRLEAKLAALVEAASHLERRITYSDTSGIWYLVPDPGQPRLAALRSALLDLVSEAAAYTASVEARTLRRAAEWLAASPAPSRGVRSAADWLRTEAQKREAHVRPTSKP